MVRAAVSGADCMIWHGGFLSTISVLHVPRLLFSWQACGSLDDSSLDSKNTYAHRHTLHEESETDKEAKEQIWDGECTRTQMNIVQMWEWGGGDFTIDIAGSCDYVA